MGFKLNGNGREWLVVLILAQFLIVFFLPDIRDYGQKFLRGIKSQSVGVSSQVLCVETEHFRVEYTKLDENDVYMVCASAEKALQALTEAGFPYTGEEKILLSIYPNTESLAESFGWERDEQAMGAYYDGKIGILAPTAWMGEEKNQLRFDREGPVLHELTHLIVDEMTEGHYNRWWTEGVAQYMEKKIYHFQMAPPEQIERFYSLEEMAQNFDRLQQRQVYWQALQAIEWMESMYSEDGLKAIMQEAAQEKDFYQGLKNVVGQDFADFERNYENMMKIEWGTGCSVEKQPITH